MRCPDVLGRPAPRSPSRPDGTGSPASARWLSLSAGSENESEKEKKLDW